MPKFITEVVSINTLPDNDACRSGDDQYVHEEGSNPITAAAFEPHKANPEVIPHGRPASASVAKFARAQADAPAT